MPWHRTGTVAITAGQNTVTGTGTAFSANARVGDAFLGPDGSWYEVTNIASGTVLSILPAYKGSTVSGGSYAIVPVQGYDKMLRDAINAMVQQWGLTLAGLGSVSIEDVVPVSKGGTGGTTAASARAGIGALGAGDYGIGIPAGVGGTSITNFAQRLPSGLYRGVFSDTANSPPNHTAGTGYTCISMAYVSNVSMYLVTSADRVWVGYYGGGSDVRWTEITGVGTGQTWKNVTASRELNTTYTNNTGRPIQLSVQAGPVTGANTGLSVTMGGAVVYAGYAGVASTYVGCANVIVPPGSSYRVTVVNGSGALTNWSELS